MSDRTLDRVGGRGTARVGKLLGGLGLYVAATAALALGVYALLVALRVLTMRTLMTPCSR